MKSSFEHETSATLRISNDRPETHLVDVVAVVADGEHASLGAHVAQVGTVEALAELDDRLVVCGRVSGSARGGGEGVGDVPISPFLRIGPAWILRMSMRATSFGSGISILRSTRPGRRRAGSSVSGWWRRVGQHGGEGPWWLYND